MGQGTRTWRTRHAAERGCPDGSTASARGEAWWVCRWPLACKDSLLPIISCRLNCTEPDGGGARAVPSIQQHVVPARRSGRELVQVDVEERVDLHAVRTDVHQPDVEPPRVVE